MHSSRMRTARSFTVSQGDVCPKGDTCLLAGWSAWGGGCLPGRVSAQGVSARVVCHVTYTIMHLMLPCMLSLLQLRLKSNEAAYTVVVM